MIRKALASVCGADSYSTPGPVVTGVSISDLAGNMHRQDWDGLVDTGAERTVVPLAACHELRLAPRDWRSPRGFDPQAERSRLPRYYVRLRVQGIGDLTLLTYAVARSNVLLGRDFLSGLVFLFDGELSRWKAGRHTAWTRLVCGLLALR